MRRPGRRLRRALVLSFLINVTVITLFVQFYRRAESLPEKQSVAEVVTIEHFRRRPHAPEHAHVVAKAAATAAKVSPQRVAATIPKPLPIPVPVPVIHRHTLVTPPIDVKPLPAPKYVPKPVVPKKIEVAAVEHPAAAAAAGPARLSQAQIAAIENNLGASIAADRDRDNPLSVRTAAVVPTMKHYGLDASSLTAGGINHSGLCSPVKQWEEDGWDYYYLQCNVRASDGTFDVESIPWPVRERPDHDPWNGTAPGGQPVAMPLPGWHLSPGQSVADGVRQYAEAHGVNL